MKKIILTLGIGIASYCSHAQNTYPWPSNGNVGIGTTSSPSSLNVIGNTILEPQNHDEGLIILGKSGAVNQKFDVQLSKGNGAYSFYRVAFAGNNIFSWGESLSPFTNNLFINNPSQGFLTLGTNNTERMRISNSGNIGIGTTTPDATKKMTISGTENNTAILFNDATDASNFYLGVFNAYGNGNFAIDEQGVANRFTIQKTTGNVGIGTATPGGSLDVKGPVSYFGTSVTDTYVNLRGRNGSYSSILNNSGTSGNYNGLTLTNNVNNINGLTSWTVDIGGADNLGYGNYDTFSIRKGNSEKLRVDGLGNLGIGTTDTKGYKLAVNGAIHSQGVYVDMTGWSDYVFDPTYNLPSLASVEAHINKNHRLPEMPSTQDVIKNGVNLGEMINLQTKKIEELTLYLIEQQKVNQSLQSQINQLVENK